MLYTTNENWKLTSKGRQPYPWFESNQTEPRETVRRYYMNKCYVEQADIEGEGELYFKFENGDCYQLSWEWDVDYETDKVTNSYRIRLVEGEDVERMFDYGNS